LECHKKESSLHRDEEGNRKPLWERIKRNYFFLFFPPFFFALFLAAFFFFAIVLWF